MSSSILQEIKDRLDIVEVISGYVKLKKMGANYGALCPFHSEKSPSFFVSKSKQIWHCFGACSEGGDVFKFIMKIEGLEFGDALRLLAKKAGVQLRAEDPQLISERKKLYNIAELACKFYEKHLHETQEGRKVSDYLLSRGLKPESIKKWRLGFAPGERKKLSDFLISRGFTSKDISDAGLLIFKEGENPPHNYFDRFRNRIIFPVFDLNSQVIGFGARRLEGTGADEPKYLNTPNTLLYDKSRLLYGLDKAKMALRKKDECILVEGYTDAIMVSQAGFENVAAVSGTALTESHLSLLKRYTKNLLLAFDMDLAGDSATRRGIDLAQARGFNIKVLVLPGAKDPADLIKEAPGAFEEVLKKSKDIVEFYFDRTLGNIKEPAALAPQEKAKVSEKLLQVILKIPNAILQEEWLSKLSQKLRIREEALREELRKAVSFLRQDFRASEPKAEKLLESQVSKKSRLELLQERVLALALKNSQVINEISQDLWNCFPPKIQNLMARLKNISESHEGPIDEQELLKNFQAQDQELLKHLLFQLEVQEVPTGKEEFLRCLQELERLLIKEKLADISLELKAAEADNNIPKVQELLEKFSQLSQKLS